MAVARRVPQRSDAFDRRSGVIVRRDGRFEGAVVFNILQADNDGFGGQSAANGVAPRPLFALFSLRPGASEGVAAIALDLTNRGHQ
jgi:hypothetical protein